MIGMEMAYEGADLSDAAWRTHCEALIWSRQRLLDLAIPKGDLLRFAYTKDPTSAAAELVMRGMWEDRGDHWYVAFHDEWQLSRDKIEKRREDDRIRQTRRRAHLLDDHSLCLPGKCSGLSRRDSRADSPGDARGDSRGDPSEVKSSEGQQLERNQQNGTRSVTYAQQRTVVFGGAP